MATQRIPERKIGQQLKSPPAGLSTVTDADAEPQNHLCRNETEKMLDKIQRPV